MTSKKASAECARMWVAKATSVHGDRYDYSCSVYTNARTKIKIRCRDHGFFYQLPHVHTTGHGCPTCKVRTIRIANSKKPIVEKPIPMGSAPWPVLIMDQFIRDRANTCAE